MIEDSLSPKDPGPPRLVSRIADTGKVCRCGSQIHKGVPYIEVVGLPSSLELMFRGETFCSTKCVQATFLENLSLLAEMATPKGGREVVDLRDAYGNLASAYLRLLDESVDGGSVNSRSRKADAKPRGNR